MAPGKSSQPKPVSRAKRMSDLVFLFDVDNTLLDNDRMQSDLFRHIGREFGEEARKRYLEIFEELRNELGYADYLGALQRYRITKLGDPRFLHMGNWLIEYPFAKLLYPGALDVVRYVRRWGKVAILSDGDAVFQPRKVEQSGLWKAFGGNVMIFIHKEQELECVESLYPSERYVMVDDKLRLLEAIKDIWQERVTTVFVRQGHYARNKQDVSKYRPADISIRHIADLLDIELNSWARR